MDHPPPSFLKERTGRVAIELAVLSHPEPFDGGLLTRVTQKIAHASKTVLVLLLILQHDNLLIILLLT